MPSLSLKDELTAIISEGITQCGYPEQDCEVTVCSNPQWGQFQYNGTFSIAKEVKKKPTEIAENVINAINAKGIFKSISVSGPGFIVMTLSDEFVRARLEKMADDPRLGVPPVKTPKKVIIDFGGPNVAKPMHVGHLRSTVIGDCLQRLYRFMGDHVSSDIHLGDWGLPMGMLITELQREKPDLPYFDVSLTDGYPEESPVTIKALETMYPAASKRCRNNASDMAAAQQATAELQDKRSGYLALWRHFITESEKALKTDLNALGVHFDCWYGESRYHDRIPQMIERLEQQGAAQHSQGAVVIHVEKETDNNPMPPLILKKSDGSYLYATTDLATLEERLKDLDADVVLYVVDQRQHLHFEQVFRAAEIAGFKQNALLQHIGFGTVNGENGNPLKTRSGGTFKLKELIDKVHQKVRERMDEADIAKSCDANERDAIVGKVAVAALKFADLINNRTSDYVFNMDKFTRFEGKTGPYCLYTTVRIKSIVRNAVSQGIEAGALIAPVSDIERALHLQLLSIPDIMIKAYNRQEPHHLCDYISDLSKAYSRFYSKHHILNEQDSARQSAWLTLSLLCMHQLELVLGVLGIEIPDRM